MALHNQAAKEIVYKIAYHGPGMSGKTTNLRFIHNTLPGRQAGRFLVLDTAVERTLYFDFLPLVFALDDSYKVRFHLYTVPGQSYYDASRKLVLKGVDGVVFVADSNPDKMNFNLESMEMLRKDLAGVEVKYSEVPLVMQYNKRDLPGALSVAELDAKLNDRKVAVIEAVAVDGIGVYETLSLVADLVTGESGGK